MPRLRVFVSVKKSDTFDGPGVSPAGTLIVDFALVMARALLKDGANPVIAGDLS
jgi:hypothetical protein